METKTIRATVSQRLLTKASRLFTGTMDGRIIEILQNARRAGANEVTITNFDGLVTVQDNGKGIDDFAKLLDLGNSGWEDDIEVSEDPAGVGLFCLAPREVSIRSQGKRIEIQNDGWTGAPVEIIEVSEPVAGTIVQFPDDEWTLERVSPHAVFTGLKVIVDGSECPGVPFVSSAASHHTELGCRIEVCAYQNLGEWHSRVRREPYYSNSVLVNFHGQVVSFDHHPVGEHSLRYLVDLTGEPTGIRLMLPARTRLVENEAFESLKAVLELEAYRFIERRGEHTLAYKEYLRAKELGISLPEAKPTYEIGLLTTSEMPEPVQIEAPKDFPLARCYRVDADQRKLGEWDASNVHLLAALGKFETPFVPVDIRSSYNGYSWANLPIIDEVKVFKKKVIHQDWLWSGTLVCVESLAIRVRTSDGRTFCSPVCMALREPTKNRQWSDADVYVTRAARQRLCSSEIWYHLGGWNEDGDTYETQESSFSAELDRYWADVVGPDEFLRQLIVTAAESVREEWTQITVAADGIVSIQLKSGQTKTLQPTESPTAAA